MDFLTYQTESYKTSIHLNKVKEKYPDLPNEVIEMLSISYMGLGLGESGEVQGKLKKVIRDAGGYITDDARKELSKELGDILWYVAGACTVLNISMDEVAKQNIEKLQDRQKRNVLSGNGDNR
jgi:NTP pyrophosphatase (non-canonical NTP hydrolase)